MNGRIPTWVIVFNFAWAAGEICTLHARESRDEMTSYVAMLRAVNVGGTGKLPMTDLRAMCEAAGLTRMRTYISSGNVIFETDASEHAVKGLLERPLKKYAGKSVGVLVRTVEELGGYSQQIPSLKRPPTIRSRSSSMQRPHRTPGQRKGRTSERLGLGVREIYVDYGPGWVVPS